MRSKLVCFFRNLNVSLPAMLLAVILCAVCTSKSSAQIVTNNNAMAIDVDSLRRDFDNQPYFGLYKDNYIVFGSNFPGKRTKSNTDVKIQLSIAQKITRTTLPFGTYLYLFYTQKLFWNVLQDSSPFYDINLNPGIGLAKPLFVRNRFIGKVYLVLEHESNGRDGLESRSWNKLSLGASIMIDPNFVVHGKAWYPMVDGVWNKDIVKYMGLYQVGLHLYSNNRRFAGSVLLNKRGDWNMLNYNTTIEISYRIFKSENQYLFLQYYNGYGEGLMDYNKFHTQIRIGWVIKPRLFSEF